MSAGKTIEDRRATRHRRRLGVSDGSTTPIDNRFFIAAPTGAEQCFRKNQCTWAYKSKVLDDLFGDNRAEARGESRGYRHWTFRGNKELQDETSTLASDYSATLGNLESRPKGGILL
jgi:hypothetical protein